MKLLFCPFCWDVKKLDREITTCKCGKVKGKYLEDGLHAVVSVDAQVICLANPDIEHACYRKDHNTIRSWLALPVIAKHIEWSKTDDIE